MHKRKEILKNSSEMTQSTATLIIKNEWIPITLFSTNAIQSKVKIVQKCPKH